MGDLLAPAPVVAAHAGRTAPCCSASRPATTPSTTTRTRTATIELNPGEDADGDGELDHALPIDRTLYKVGNFPLNDASFVWVRADRVTGTARPADVLTVEWEEKGNLYGALVAVTDGETRVSVEADGFDATLARLHAWKERTDALTGEAHEIAEGPLADVQEERVKAQRRLLKAEYHYGPDSPEARAVRAANAEQEQELAAKATELTKEIRALEAQADPYRVELRAASGEIIPQRRGGDAATEPVAIADLTRVYPANALGFFDKLGIYFSRWGEYLSEAPRQANSEGGVYPAIVGTVMLTFLMILLVVPLGVIAAIYLREYARQGPLTSLVRISVNNLAGVPSIVYGVFGYGFFCILVGGWIDGGPRNVGYTPLAPGHWLLALGGTALVVGGALVLGYVSARVGKSDKVAGGAVPRLVAVGLFVLWASALLLVGLLLLTTPFFDGLYPYLAAVGSPVVGKGAVLWASLTLALLTLPVVIVATEEALSAVPKSMREGAYACGASKWQTIRKIVLPRALPGIMTGTILALARGAGEVAPIMLVGALHVGGKVPFDAGDNPVTGLDGWFGLNQSFQHLGLNIYGLGFQSPDSEAARPLLFTTVLLLITIVVTLSIAAIHLRSRLRKSYAGGAF